MWTGCLVLVVVNLALPAYLTGLCVERDQDAVGRVVEDHVLEDGDAFGPGPHRPADDVGHVLGNLAPVFPDLVAVDGVDRQHAGTWADDVHNALGDDRRRLRGACRQTACPRHPELADIAAVDLIERTETLLVVGA